MLRPSYYIADSPVHNLTVC